MRSTTNGGLFLLENMTLTNFVCKIMTHFRSRLTYLDTLYYTHAVTIFLCCIDVVYCSDSVGYGLLLCVLEVRPLFD